jgi:putative membrane protein
MGWWCGNGFGWGGFGWIGALFGGLIMLLFLGLLAVLAIWAIRALGRSQGRGSGIFNTPNSRPDDRALSVLKERYARGEIDRDTYDRMRRDLSV